MNYKLFLWINQSNGDTLGMIPLINALISKYPETKIRFGCYEDQAYLLKHLPIEVFPISGDYKNMAVRTNSQYFMSKVDPLIYKNYTCLHLWGGLYYLKHIWQDQIKTFNQQCANNNINLVLDDSVFGYIELPIVDVNVKANAVYVENSQPVSGQTNFQYDMYKLGLMFPRINFYTVGPINFSANNVHDCSKKSLIELSSISRKCKLILGKGSGPFFCTLNEENKHKTKVLAGLMGGFRYKFWNLNDENTLLLDTEQEIFELLRPINRGQ
jgi:hypothetical protein